MHVRNLIAASAVTLIASSGASLAQETMTDGLVMVNVAGSMVPVPVSVAAQACGMDAAAVIEAADMANTDAKGADMVASEPGASGTAAPDTAAADDSLTSDDPAAADTTTEAAVGTGAGTTETDAGTVAEASTDTADAGLTAETATGGDQPADATGADPEASAGADMATPTAVCEIDQATADQYGISMSGETSGG